VIVASEDGLKRHGLGLDRAARVTASAGRSQRVYEDATRYDAMLTEETISSDDALVAYVRATLATQFHPCGTARMGPPGDAMAIVDQYCRLRATATCA